MSFDLGVWYPHSRLSAEEAGAVYVNLCNGDTSAVRPHAAIDDFYRELTAKHPEIDTIPDDLVDDVDYCPWSCGLDYSPAHVIMPCVWSRSEYVNSLVHGLARKHGLAVFDPQTGNIAYPDGQIVQPERRKPWWRFW